MEARQIEYGNYNYGDLQMTESEFITTANETDINTLGRLHIVTRAVKEATAYLVMMSPRLEELYRVLKNTGSLLLEESNGN